MKNIQKICSILLLTSTGFAVISCAGKKEEPAGRQGRGQGSLIVDAVVVSPLKLEENVRATANLLSYEEVEIKAPVAGTVMSINFKEGQYVKRGQPLIKIDDRNWKAQISGSKAQHVNAVNELERKKELLKIGGASQEDVDNAQASVDALEADIERLQVNVTLANVVAPFDGQVGMRNFSLGSYLSQGQLITILSESRKLKVDFNIPTRYMESIRIGNIVKVASASDTIDAVIYAINPTVSMTSRTIQVRAEILDNVKNFVPGDFAEVIVPVRLQDSAVVVPTNVIVPELNSQTIYVYSKGKAVRREISAGVRTDRVVQILEGLSYGDTLITTGLIQIKDKMPVQIGNISKISSL